MGQIGLVEERRISGCSLPSRTEDETASGPSKPPAETVAKDIRRRSRKQHSAEEKIRVVQEGLRGEDSIA
jgi:hypothetical protein